jgi:murein DD-endopeptidase MepM/ murein hydrolase activator NlpD
VPLKSLARFIAFQLVLAAVLLGPGREATIYAFWWFTNTEPPQLVLAAPPGPSSTSEPGVRAVRGAIEVPVDARPSGRVDLLSVELDAQQLPPDDNVEIDTTSLPDGEHVLTVRAQDRSLRRNSALESLRFRSDNTAPNFEVQARPPNVPQGHSAIIHIRPSEPAEVSAQLGGAPLRLFAAGPEYWGVVGFDSDAEPGARDFVVEGRDRVGNAGRAGAELSVVAFEFTRDRIQVPESMLPLLAPSVRAAEEDRLMTVYRQDNGPPLWKGPFRQPVLGPVSTEFGEVRSYNGGPFQGHHNGTDFQAALGTPVQAPARGRVALHEEVRLRGRILILDHGAGVYTTYAHLSEWLVEPGQEVEPGQPIARVGSTGLSTGPHLHWELWVGGTSVDPMEWTEREVP